MRLKSLTGILLSMTLLVALVVLLYLNYTSADEYPSGMIEDQPDKSTESDRKVGLKRNEAAPDFELENLAGEPVKLSDYRGKKVFLNFWASWCGPCQTEMPYMQQYYTKRKADKDVEILAINMTKNELNIERVKEFVQSNGLTFPILLDTEGEIERKYKVLGFPTTYLIDETGNITGTLKGAVRNSEEIYTMMDTMK